MKKTIFILTLLFLTTIKNYGQYTDTSFYSSGKLQAVKFYQDNKIVRAITFKESGEEKYYWDIPKKILISYDAISYLDTLAEYFKVHCPTYTLYQHYGNGPLYNIENYKNNVRDGDYVGYSRDGKITSKGQFTNWKKTGIWTYYDENGKAEKQIHWFHHDFSEGGISINYTIVPIVITILLIFASFFLFIRKGTYSSYFISYSLFTTGLFIALYLLGHILREETLATISTYTAKILFPIMTTLVLAMLFFSLSTLILKNKTGVKPIYSILSLIISIGLGFVLLGTFIASKMTGFVM